MLRKWIWTAGFMLMGAILMGTECEEAYYGSLGEGYYDWDGGILTGWSREGDNTMYTNWYTDTAISSDGDAGYIALGDGTFYSW
jgi:hypothetical protein